MAMRARKARQTENGPGKIGRGKKNAHAKPSRKGKKQKFKALSRKQCSVIVRRGIS